MSKSLSKEALDIADAEAVTSRERLISLRMQVVYDHKWGEYAVTQMFKEGKLPDHGKNG